MNRCNCYCRRCCCSCICCSTSKLMIALFEALSNVYESNIWPFYSKLIIKSHKKNAKRISNQDFCSCFSIHFEMSIPGEKKERRLAKLLTLQWMAKKERKKRLGNWWRNERSRVQWKQTKLEPNKKSLEQPKLRRSRKCKCSHHVFPTMRERSEWHTAHTLERHSIYWDEVSSHRWDNM